MKKIKDIITLEQVLEARREGLIEATEQHNSEYWQGHYEGELSMVEYLLNRIKIGE